MKYFPNRSFLILQITGMGNICGCIKVESVKCTTNLGSMSERVGMGHYRIIFKPRSHSWSSIWKTEEYTEAGRRDSGWVHQSNEVPFPSDPNKSSPGRDKTRHFFKLLQNKAKWYLWNLSTHEFQRSQWFENSIKIPNTSTMGPEYEEEFESVPIYYANLTLAQTKMANKKFHIWISPTLLFSHSGGLE